MFKLGDKVFIEESADCDFGFQARRYISQHMYALVKGYAPVRPNTPESEYVYALEWDEEFSGGIDCNGLCADRRGQWVTAKHLSLDFEASRQAVTVPVFPDSDRVDMTKWEWPGEPVVDLPVLSPAV
jgi:hypothetical protein